MTARTYTQRLDSVLDAVEALSEDGASDLNDPTFDDCLVVAAKALLKARKVATGEEEGAINDNPYPFPGTGATQQDIDVWTFRNIGADGIRIVVDILLSLTFEMDADPDKEPDPSRWILDYVGEALHGGDYASSKEEFDDPDNEYPFLLTVDVINTAANWVLNRAGGDARTALRLVEEVRALAFTGEEAI